MIRCLIGIAASPPKRLLNGTVLFYWGYHIMSMTTGSERTNGSEQPQPTVPWQATLSNKSCRQGLFGVWYNIHSHSNGPQICDFFGGLISTGRDNWDDSKFVGCFNLPNPTEPVRCKEHRATWLNWQTSMFGSVDEGIIPWTKIHSTWSTPNKQKSEDQEISPSNRPSNSVNRDFE
jgi:hypothetical protein